MIIQELFDNEPEEIYSLILKYICDKELKSKKWVDYGNQKFGASTFFDAFKRSKIHENIDIEPIQIIGTVNHSNFSNRPLFDIFSDKERKYRFIECFSKNNNHHKDYFFSKINARNESEAMTFYSINDLQGNKKYIIRHGHHRSLIAYFLQLIDNSYRLKGIEVTELVLHG